MSQARKKNHTYQKKTTINSQLYNSILSNLKLKMSANNHIKRKTSHNKSKGINDQYLQKLSKEKYLIFQITI